MHEYDEEDSPFHKIVPDAVPVANQIALTVAALQDRPEDPKVAV